MQFVKKLILIFWSNLLLGSLVSSMLLPWVVRALTIDSFEIISRGAWYGVAVFCFLFSFIFSVWLYIVLIIVFFYNKKKGNYSVKYIVWTYWGGTIILTIILTFKFYFLLAAVLTYLIIGIILFKLILDIKLWKLYSEESSV